MINNYLLLYDASVRIAVVRLIGGDHPLQKRDLPQENVFAPRFTSRILGQRPGWRNLAKFKDLGFSDPLFMSEGWWWDGQERDESAAELKKAGRISSHEPTY